MRVWSQATSQRPVRSPHPHPHRYEVSPSTCMQCMWRRLCGILHTDFTLGLAQPQHTRITAHDCCTPTTALHIVWWCLVVGGVAAGPAPSSHGSSHVFVGVAFVAVVLTVIQHVVTPVRVPMFSACGAAPPPQATALKLGAEKEELASQVGGTEGRGTRGCRVLSWLRGAACGSPRPCALCVGVCFWARPPLLLLLACLLACGTVVDHPGRVATATTAPATPTPTPTPRGHQVTGIAGGYAALRCVVRRRWQWPRSAPSRGTPPRRRRRGSGCACCGRTPRWVGQGGAL